MAQPQGKNNRTVDGSRCCCVVSVVLPLGKAVPGRRPRTPQTETKLAVHQATQGKSGRSHVVPCPDRGMRAAILCPASRRARTGNRVALFVACSSSSSLGVLRVSSISTPLHPSESKQEIRQRKSSRRGPSSRPHLVSP